MGDLFNSIMYPIELLVAWIMYGFHSFFTMIGLPAASGWTWSLSIVGLVVVMRAAMIPLFVKQINASRKMQLIQPELQKIQKKYKGKTDPESRQAMTQETMQLYRREGTNPFSSCLPILLQSPFFFGLFRVLNGLQAIAKGDKDPIGPITRTVAAQAESASIFGAQLSAKFVGAETLNVKVITIILIVLMSLSTFTSQRQLMMKNMPASALDNPFAKQQKIMLYVIPFFFFISGPNFPIGVLIYWLTTNVWSMSQQFYVIRKMPAPGSEAEKAMHARLARRGKPIPEQKSRAGAAGGGAAGTGDANTSDGAGAADGTEAVAPKQSGQRQQPKGKKRAKAKRPQDSAIAATAGSGNPSSGIDGADPLAAGTDGVAAGTDGVAPGPAPGGRSKKQRPPR